MNINISLAGQTVVLGGSGGGQRSPNHLLRAKNKIFKSRNVINEHHLLKS